MNYSEKIDKYLDGELQGNELRQFENELIFNSKLAKAVDKYRRISDFIKLQHAKITSGKNNFTKDHKINDIINTYRLKNGEEEPENIKLLRKQLENAHKSYIRKTGIHEIKKLRRICYAAAAVFLLITVTSVFYYLQTRTYSNERLYSIYYEPYNKNIFTRIESVEPEGVFMQAMVKYADEDYKNALDLFKQVPSTDDFILPANFYSGISFMQTAQYHEAINSFLYIIKNPDNELIYQSEWYLGLCYLKTNETDKAFTQFKNITGSNSIYKEEAEDILKKLKN
jgi:TolA-binding protein